MSTAAMCNSIEVSYANAPNVYIISYGESNVQWTSGTKLPVGPECHTLIRSTNSTFGFKNQLNN